FSMSSHSTSVAKRAFTLPNPTAASVRNFFPGTTTSTDWMPGAQPESVIGSVRNSHTFSRGAAIAVLPWRRIACPSELTPHRSRALFAGMGHSRLGHRPRRMRRERISPHDAAEHILVSEAVRFENSQGRGAGAQDEHRADKRQAAAAVDGAAL